MSAQRLEIASRILAGFAANPAVFAKNGQCGWSLVNATDEDISGYALKLAWKRSQILERELTAAHAEIAELREQCDRLAEWCVDLRGEWQWKKDEPRAGNKAQYDALCADIDSALVLRKAHHGGAHE